MIGAYHEPGRSRGRQVLTGLIDSLGRGVPAASTELLSPGRTPRKRAEDVLVPSDRTGTSNGPAEAVNGRLEHLRGSALGFRDLARHITGNLPEAGGFRPRPHPGP
jgi:transposase